MRLYVPTCEIRVQSVEIAANGGKVLYVGTAHKDVNFSARSFEAIIRKELSLFGSWMSYSAPFPGQEWKLAVRALSDGRIKAEEMITHRFELAKAKEAFETLRSCEDAVKVMLVG